MITSTGFYRHCAPDASAPVPFATKKYHSPRKHYSVSRRGGGGNKGGRKQMRANANKRRQTLTNASKRRGENASKRKQTRANVDKRRQTLTPPFIPLFTPHLCNLLNYLPENIFELFSDYRFTISIFFELIFESYPIPIAFV